MPQLAKEVAAVDDPFRIAPGIDAFASMFKVADGARRDDLGKHQRRIAHAALHARQLLPPCLTLGLVQVEGIDVGHQRGFECLDIAGRCGMTLALGTDRVENPARIG